MPEKEGGRMQMHFWTITRDIGIPYFIFVLPNSAYLSQLASSGGESLPWYIM
jgi:hypothetical protein